jgi:hypothetical protein
VGTWKNDRLGTLVITVDPRDAKKGVRADAGEWSSRLGWAKEDNGAEHIVLLDAPLTGMPLQVVGDALVLDAGQDSFKFTK